MEARSAAEIEESTERLLQDLKAVVHDGEQLLRAGANELSERGQAARERLAAALDARDDSIERLLKQAEYERRARGYFREFSINAAR